ncbi:MAG: hypothetical protein IT320_18820 [Anaerolineae bacterium]|nr:hypothetical protein [Anaerolineae bacterium]
MIDSSTLPEKRCTKCGETYPATAEYFNRDKRHRDGLHSWCKQCSREGSRAYHAANAERVRENKRNWREANPERHRENNRVWRNANLERQRERNRVWYAANPEHARAISHNREARKRGLPSTFTAEQARFALDYFHNSCAYCGRQFHDLFNERTLAFDHFIPLASPDCPGTTAGNMLPVRHGVDGCNTSKGARDPEVWLIEHFGKRKACEIKAHILSYFEIVSTSASKGMH